MIEVIREREVPAAPDELWPLVSDPKRLSRSGRRHKPKPNHAERHATDPRGT